MHADTLRRAPQLPETASFSGADGTAFAAEADHLAGLHRGLLLLLSLAILMLLPTIVWSGAGGTAWTEAWREPAGMSAIRVAAPRAAPKAAATMPAAAAARVPLNREAKSRESVLR